MQGYHLDDQQAGRMNTALRLTPAVCVVLAVTGLLLASPVLFGVLAVLGGVGAAFARGNLIDRFYNVAIRPLFDGPTLPPAPPPRRFSCALAGAFSAVATAGFVLGAAWVGYLFGTFVILGSGLAATTHWCLGGWIYGRLFGRPGCETA
jgi:hypothetical protein